jgi:hypothetical protein
VILLIQWTKRLGQAQKPALKYLETTANKKAALVSSFQVRVSGSFPSNS